MLPVTMSWLVLVMSAVCGFAQTSSWDDLRSQGTKARKEARYDDAERLLRAAREEARRLESDDRLLVSLSDLAELFQAQGRYSEAEEPLTRALTLKQKALGFSSPEIVPAMDALAFNQLALKKQYDVR